MELNRRLQFDILVALREVYPDSMLVSALPGFSSGRDFMGNLFYLQEHEFIRGGDIREPGQCRSMVDAEITKAGLDFLAEDSGLKAILGYEAVKIDADELKKVLLDNLGKANLSDENFTTAREGLDALDAEALKSLLLTILRQGGSVDQALLNHFQLEKE